MTPKGRDGGNGEARRDASEHRDALLTVLIDDESIVQFSPVRLSSPRVNSDEQLENRSAVESPWALGWEGLSSVGFPVLSVLGVPIELVNHRGHSEHRGHTEGLWPTSRIPFKIHSGAR